MIGKVVDSNADLTFSDYYFWKRGYPFLPGDKVMFEKAIFECAEGLESIGCAWNMPGTDIIGLDFKEQPILNPWIMTSELPAKELNRPRKPSKEPCIQWKYAEQFVDKDEIFGSFERRFDPTTL